MKRYSYKARTKDGKLMAGVVEAVDERQAVGLLRERNLIVVHLATKTAVFDFSNLPFLGVNTTTLANFTRQMATMINAGLNVVDALLVLENQNEGKMKRVIAEVRNGVESGKSLSKTMETQLDVFDEVYLSLIRAGEAAGVLDKVLLKLADNLEKKRDFQSKVKGAMLYPIIILIGMIAVMLVMVLFVIPQLADLYEEFEADLPLVTKLLISFSDLVASFWWAGLLLIGVVFVVWRMANNNVYWRMKIDAVMLSSPIFGSLWEQILLTNVTLTLSMLTAAGVPIVESMNLTSRVAGNKLYKAGILDAAKMVEKGFSLAQAFSQQGYFPMILPQMLSVGEETGQVDVLMEKVSIYFQTESEQKVKNLTTAIEPIILIILGAGVGFLVFAVVMPIYNLTTTL